MPYFVIRRCEVKKSDYTLFTFFDPGFNRLTGVVGVKPARQMAGDGILSVMQQGAVAYGSASVKALQGHVQRLLNLSSWGVMGARQRPSSIAGLDGVGQYDHAGRMGRGGRSAGPEHPRSAPRQQLARCPS
jgi:hypothetical protein